MKNQTQTGKVAFGSGLNDPIIAYDKKGTINLLLKATDNNSNVILVAIKPNGTAQVNNVIIDSNFLLSAYGKEEIIKY